MEEKFKKALKTLKQGIWVLLILSLVMNIFAIVTLSKEGENIFLNYIKENVFSFIQTVALITGLVFFAKGKYKTGAQVTQWSGMASIIISFATIITTYIIMGNLGESILSIALPYILTGLIIPIILIVDSLKVLRLAETDEQQKNIVPVLAIIVIVAVIAFNTITIIETKNTIEDLKEQIQNTILDMGIQSIDKTENIKETNKPEDKIDPYANYKDVKWCGQKEKLIEIKNGKVLITHAGSTSYKLTNDKPKSVAMYIVGGVPEFLVLGESGKVYKVDEENNTKLVEVKELSNNIIAMTTQKSGVNDRPIYFLTSNGELIDFNGYTYEENNKDLTGTYGRFCPMYFNTAGNVYYINRNNEKVYIKDKQSKNIVAKAVFWQSISLDETYTILTTNNQLVYFTYDGDYNISYNNQKIKSYKFQEVNGENNSSQLNVVFSMENNTNVTITDIHDVYYDVTNGKAVEIVTVEDIVDDFNQAAQELGKITTALQNHIASSYDGKMISGNEVIAACKMYNNSKEVSVKVIVDKDKHYQVGKYDVKINEDVLKTLNKRISGGINVEPTGDNKYEEIKQNSLNEIENLSETMRTQTYYSYVMKDTETREVIGVAFVRNGTIN